MNMNQLLTHESKSIDTAMQSLKKANNWLSSFIESYSPPNNIMELITALHLSGAIRRIDGTRVDLATLVDVLSRTFNVRINNPE